MQRKSELPEFNQAGYEDLQDDFLDELAGTLRRLKRSDESIESTTHYNFFFNLKNRVFENTITLETALSLLQEFKISSSEPYSNAFTSLKSNLINTLQARPENLKYKEDSNQDAVDQLRRAYIAPPTEKTIVDTLLSQCSALNDPKHLKDEMLQVLLIMERERSGMVCEFISILDLKTPIQPSEGAIGGLLRGDPAEQMHLQRSVALFSKIDNILEQKAMQGIMRTQFIFREGVHYYAADANTLTRTLVLLDAANDTRKKRMHLLPGRSASIRVLYDAEDTLGVRTTPNTIKRYKLQLDEASCVFFATDHARHAYHTPDLHERLIECKAGAKPNEKGVITCDWTDLPPRMLKNSQSTGYLDACVNRYKQRDIKEAEDLIELTSNNSKCFAINKVKTQAIQEVKELCAAKKPDEIEAMLEQKENQPTLRLGKQ